MTSIARLSNTFMISSTYTFTGKRRRVCSKFKGLSAAPMLAGSICRGGATCWRMVRANLTHFLAGAVSISIVWVEIEEELVI